MVKVSVIIPVYNTEKYLAECLDSILKQGIKEEIELILINDGSSDKSLEIIEEYAKQHMNIRYQITPNRGQASARNLGISMATGEYISFVDSDDTIREDMLEKTYQKAKEENLDIVVFDYIEMYPDKQQIYCSGVLGQEDATKGYIIGMPGPCNKIFKREFLQKQEFKFWEGHIYEDLATIPGLAAQTEKIGKIEEGFYFYRICSNSTIQRKKESSKLADRITAIEKMYEQFAKFDKIGYYHSEIEYNYIQHLLHAASLELIKTENGKEYLNKIQTIIKSKFPNWRKNPYYQKQSMKYKIMCELIERKQYWLIRSILGK